MNWNYIILYFEEKWNKIMKKTFLFSFSNFLDIKCINKRKTKKKPRVIDVYFIRDDSMRSRGPRMWRSYRLCIWNSYTSTEEEKNVCRKEKKIHIIRRIHSYLYMLLPFSFLPSHSLCVIIYSKHSKYIFYME